MSQEKRFCSTHQWVEFSETGRVKIGISDHAQDALGDIVYVELPAAGAEFKAGEAIATIESVKTASEIQSPVSGRLIAANEQLEDDPELLNEAPLATWVFELEVDSGVFAREWAELLDEDAYNQYLADQ
ncbi:glycine cleavage system protein GcvH [Marinospirillum perlucidum]|uniref:glycine cleavage system protein GcvH n=1 Tax=Marinospirillum perlucidum TaxID=1982602 RepID=UPI000DF2C276|nr:glycine cleavage system protein GcvH [Marinospirillum perlucidum]